MSQIRARTGGCALKGFPTLYARVRGRSWATAVEMRVWYREIILTLRNTCFHAVPTLPPPTTEDPVEETTEAPQTPAPDDDHDGNEGIAEFNLLLLNLFYYILI